MISIFCDRPLVDRPHKVVDRPHGPEPGPKDEDRGGEEHCEDAAHLRALPRQGPGAERGRRGREGLLRSGGPGPGSRGGRGGGGPDPLQAHGRAGRAHGGAAGDGKDGNSASNGARARIQGEKI